MLKLLTRGNEGGRSLLERGGREGGGGFIRNLKLRTGGISERGGS